MEQELQYAYLLEIPVESCRIVTRRAKRRTKGAEERLKARVIGKVNEEAAADAMPLTGKEKEGLQAAEAVGEALLPAGQTEEGFSQEPPVAALEQGEGRFLDTAQAEFAQGETGAFDTEQPEFAQGETETFNTAQAEFAQGETGAFDTEQPEFAQGETETFDTAQAEFAQGEISEESPSAASLSDAIDLQNFPPISEVMQELAPTATYSEGKRKKRRRAKAKRLEEKRDRGFSPPSLPEQTLFGGLIDTPQAPAKQLGATDGIVNGTTDGIVNGATESVVSEERARFSSPQKVGKKSGVSFAVAVAVCLVMALGFLANAFVFRFDAVSYFAALAKEPDSRTHADFALALPVSEKVELKAEGGVISFLEKGGVYAPAEGTVVSVRQAEGGYTLEIAHSDCFKTVITGADIAFFSEGERVYRAQPVAYNTAGDLCVSFYENGALLSNCTVQNGAVSFS
ncbi:MAG: hypothetical protein II370_04425 [Clostridia bacterium]|nr:hypothetical protein [Clostridia bacterium]